MSEAIVPNPDDRSLTTQISLCVCVCVVLFVNVSYGTRPDLKGAH